MVAPQPAAPAPNLSTSHTLWSPHDTVKDVAETLGIANQLNEDVSKNLAMDVEYRIHEILEQALKFMRHSKRKTLTTSDIDKAMKILNIEPLYGYDIARPLIFKEALVGPGQTLYYIDDDVIDFEKLINQPLPKIPKHTNFTAHWLAIEGIQPTIPQNPLPYEIKNLPPFVRGSMNNMFSLNNDDDYDENDPNGNSNDSNGGSKSISSLTKKDKDNKDKDKNSKLDVKPLVKHMLSKELQLYFNKAIESLLNENEEFEHIKEATLISLKTDPGLHQLIPYFIQFIAETITNNLKNINLLTTMLMTIYSLLINKSIFLDPYIHALMPCILTLLLAKKIGPTTSSTTPSTAGTGTTTETASQSDVTQQQHFQIRDLASSLLDQIIKNYGSSYTTLKPRITRTLLRAFLSYTTKSCIGTQYGSIKGLKCLGTEVIRVIMTNNLSNWSNVVIEDQFAKGTSEYELLVNNVIDCLELLAKEAKLDQAKEESSAKRRKITEDGDVESMDVDSESNSGEKQVLTEAMKEKLIGKIGELLTTEIEARDNAVDLYNGIFFGEL